MNRGYVKLWRKSLDSGWLQNPELWAFWSWCLLRASHKVMRINVGFQEITLQPGEFVFGRNKASIELKMTEKRVRTCLEFLRKKGNLTISATNKFSIVTITHWDQYQGGYFENNTLKIQPTTDSQPPAERINPKKNYAIFFEDFWKAYPDRNEKKLGKAETFRRYCRIKEADLPLVNQAAANYACSDLVTRGIGIKDPKRFIRDGKDDEPWREWIEPEKVKEASNDPNEWIERAVNS